MYTIFFISFVVSFTCFGCYLHPSSGAQLQRTAIGCVWFGGLFHWSRYWFGTSLHLSTVSYSTRNTERCTEPQTSNFNLVLSARDRENKMICAYGSYQMYLPAMFSGDAVNLCTWSRRTESYVITHEDMFRFSNGQNIKLLIIPTFHYLISVILHRIA
jgi:hypothetical protein